MIFDLTGLTDPRQLAGILHGEDEHPSGTGEKRMKSSWEYDERDSMSGSESKTDTGAHALGHAGLVAALRAENQALRNRWRRAAIAACTAVFALLAVFAALALWATADAGRTAAAVVTLAALAFCTLILLLPADPVPGDPVPGDPVPGVPAGRLLATRYGIDGVDAPDTLVPASGALEIHRTRPDRRDTWTVVRDGDLIRVYDVDGNVVEPMEAEARGTVLTTAGEAE